MAIVWAGGRFRMILHAEGGQFAVADPFDRLVVQAAVRYFKNVG